MLDNNKLLGKGDAIFSGQSSSSIKEDLVGLKDLKKSLENGTLEQQVACLSEAIKYGDDGWNLITKTFINTSGNLMWTAYKFLLKNTDTKIKQILWTYNPYRFFDCLSTLGSPASNLKDAIEAVTITPNGQTVVSSRHDALIKVWDLQTKQELYSFIGHLENVRSVVISPDGESVVILGDRSTMNDRIIRLCNLKTGQQIRHHIGHSGYVNSFVISPDGQTLIIGSHKPKISLWELSTGQQIRTIGEDSGSFLLCVLLVWSNPDRSLLVGSDCGRALKIWNLETGQLLHTLRKHTDEGLCAAISPDGRTLVSGSQDTTLIVWDLEAGEDLYTIKGLKGHSDYITSVAFSPDGQTFASSSWDKTIKIWDVNTGNEICVLRGHTDFVSSITFSPDGQTLISGSWDGTIKVWGMAI
ncbi:WD40 repeat domain-containing protein [Argonema antarcticum]|uniref:WD40 repeat domain-containing protein n=1 Tax=Argonema antarcticum TaxID=2942763 RepID=UPI002011654F|nr:WD40 repeat domain-containing protein [Argonema antarcticum]MCL1474219.1 WD40 repeat domain-containing protein [Argonema antarcticum A004/B2]